MVRSFFAPYSRGMLDWYLFTFLGSSNSLPTTSIWRPSLMEKQSVHYSVRGLRGLGRTQPAVMVQLPVALLRRK